MPGGMPASGREAVKGALACAVAASWPGTRLLSCRSSQRQSWLGTCPFFQAGSTGRRRTSRRQLAQNFENEPSFQFLSVSAPIQPKAEFDLFSREVSVRTQTILSLPLEPTLQPLRRPHPHFPRPHSPNSPFGHPPVWPWQADFGSSISSLDMPLEPILCS